MNDDLKKLKGIIYKITNVVNKKSYIGRSKNSFWKRYRAGDWIQNSHNEELKTDVELYGPDKFHIEILISGVIDDQLADKESQFIIEYNTLHPSGYNHTINDNGCTSLTYREKLSSEVRKAKFLKPDKRRGTKLSPEACLNLRRSHLNLTHPKALIVQQLDKITGDVLREFPSISSAAREMHRNSESIRNVCYGKRKSSAGYGWKFKIDSPHIGDVRKKIVQIDVVTNTIVAEYNSIVEAARAVGSRPSNISAVCRGLGMTAKGFKWKYYETN